jgi:hypothetical protein
MDVREDVKIWSLCAKFIGHVVLVRVQRVSGLALSDLINTITHTGQNNDEVEVTYQSRFVRLAPIVRLLSLPPNFGGIYK